MESGVGNGWKLDWIGAINDLMLHGSRDMFCEFIEKTRFESYEKTLRHSTNHMTLKELTYYWPC